tara:strand:+ start:52 stop:714 length:663 start_codon:yes stop_codon:yes gene_type:complete
MTQTSFFKQPEENEPTEIIPIDPNGLQPRKVEELLPDNDIKPDTYMIYPNGGYHPFYGVPNTLPRYQQRIWPFIKRIKFSTFFKSREALNRNRTSSQSKNQTLEQVNCYWEKGYYKINLNLNSRYLATQYTKLKKNGQPVQYIGEGRAAKLFHRLVALAFIPNPKNKPFVLHINDDRTNFLLENLKWGTPGENMKGKLAKRPDTMEQKYLNCVEQGFIKG